MIRASRAPLSSTPQGAAEGARARSRHLAFVRHAMLALLACVAGPTLADDDCHVPVEQWQPREAVRRMAAEKGWQVRRLKIDDGCYEIRGTDAEGRRFKAKIDPQDLSIVEFKSKRGERRRHDAAPPRDPANR